MWNRNKCFLGLNLFCGLYNEMDIGTDEVWYGAHARPYYRSCIDQRRYNFLLARISVQDHKNMLKEYKSDMFFRARWFLSKFESNARAYYEHSEMVVLDETLRNYFGRDCQFTVFLQDKPGQMGILYFTLGDCKSRYFSRIIPKSKPGTGTPVPWKMDDVVMEMASDITGQGRIFITDRGYSSIPVNEKLFQQRTLHVGTIRTDRKGLPTDAKKKQPLHSTKFYWKTDSPTMCIAYQAKKPKNVLLVSSAHELPVIDDGSKKKPEAVHFYNQMRCGVDIFNRMLRDMRSQPKSDWLLGVITL